MTGPALQIGAIAATGVSFALFARCVVQSLVDGLDQRARAMGDVTSRQFEDVFLFIPGERLAEMGRFAAVTVFFLFFIPLFSFTSMLSTGVGVALGLAAGFWVFRLPARIVRILRERRRVRFEEQLVGALGTMSNALKAGFSIMQAFENVVAGGEKPIAQEFQVFLQQQRVGMAFDEALASLNVRVGSKDLELVVTAVDVARRTGGNLTEIFDRISETIRGRLRIEHRVRTLTAQGRLQGLVVSFMPFVLGLAMTALKPDLMLPFLTSLTGIACVALAAVLVLVGWLVIRRIIRISV